MKNFFRTFLLIFSFLFAFGMNAQVGIAGRSEMGFGSDFNLHLFMSFGKYAFPNWYIGGGAGWNIAAFQYYNEETKEIGRIFSFPLVAESQYFMFKNSAVNPFTSLQMGTEFVLNHQWLGRGDGMYRTENSYQMVGVFAPGVGVKLRLIGRYSLFLKLAVHWRTHRVHSLSERMVVPTIGLGF